MAGRPAAAKKLKLENGSSAPAPTQQPSSQAIPIDPALTQAGGPGYPHYQPYMPGAAPNGMPPRYPMPFPPHYAMPPPQQAPARQPAQASTSGGSGGELADVSTLNDALGSAGVDLRAEEESLTRGAPRGAHKEWNIREDRSRRPALVDTRLLGTQIQQVANHHGLKKGAPEDAVNYIAAALRARLQGLITSMVAATAHRLDAQVTHDPGMYDEDSPMWDHVVRRDVGKQLAALEKAEREEEQRARKERKDRLELAAAHAAALAAQAAGGADDDEPKKKKKKEGPGVTAKNMPEEVRKKMSNAVASHAAGLSTKKYSWMSGGTGGGGDSSSTSAPKVKAGTPAPDASPAASTPGPGTAAAGPAAPGAQSSWVKPYVPTTKGATAAAAAAAGEEQRTITLRDAMFVVERERGHGGGRGAARGWT